MLRIITGMSAVSMGAGLAAYFLPTLRLGFLPRLTQQLRGIPVITTKIPLHDFSVNALKSIKTKTINPSNLRPLCSKPLGLDLMRQQTGDRYYELDRQPDRRLDA
jgi:hypothetical protein